MSSLKFSKKFLRFNELTEQMKAYAEEYPSLVKMVSLGKSYEGRDIWLLKITNYETGDDSEKPAVWVDANIHAMEVSTSAVGMYFVDTITKKFGDDEEITRALNTRAFYVLPRINPDGAELILADHPKTVRSSTRPYPYNEEPLGGGLLDEDLDGDGRILFMRYRDPNGSWKEHPDYPGLMIKRDPTEVGGEYYRVLPEGSIDEFDGDNISVRSLHAQVTWPRGPWPKEGLDINRNFPMNWKPESEQLGAGPYPVSEPEIRAMVDFIVTHPNIIASNSFHTFAGIMLRPYDHCSDDEMIPEDLRVYNLMGEVGSKFTGYPAMNQYPNFRTRPKMTYAGSQNMWFYDHLGKLAWTIEMWNPLREIGKKDYHIQYFKWFSDHKVEDDVALYKWAKETWGNEGYVDWYEYDHPQLGTVELGGWNWAYTWANVPEKFLEREVAPFTNWFLWTALISPLLAERKITVEPLGGDNYRVRLVLENTGYLPTYVTKKAIERQIRGVLCEVELPDGATMIEGEMRQDLGQLEGYAYKDAFLNPKQDSTKERVTVDWVIYAPNGGKMKIVSRHDRAGIVRSEIDLNG